MTDQPPPKWALLFLSGLAVFSGVAFVYGWVRGGFELIRLAVFILFAALVAEASEGVRPAASNAPRTLRIGRCSRA